MSERSDNFEASMGILPIHIRPDLAVRVYGIPFDLTKAEADKIAAVVMAFAGSCEEHPR